MIDRTKRQRRSERGVLGVHLMMIALILLPHPVVPATITVDGQTGDATPGICDLVEAIQNAEDDAATNADCEAGSGDDEIVLTVDVTLTERNNGSPTAGNGLPPINGANGAITIEGNDHTIARDAGATDLFRHFRVGLSGDLSLNEVTLSGGLVSNDSNDSVGGSILNQGGTLTITNSTISGNTVLGTAIGPMNDYTFAYGGGLYNNGDATISNSTFTGNVAEGNNVSAYKSVAAGAAISNGTFYSNFTPTLVLTESTISGNSATAVADFFSVAYTAGIYAAQGTVSITNSTISGNSSYSTSMQAISQSGAMEATGAVTTLFNTTISSNMVDAQSGVYYYEGAGGIDFFSFGGSLELNETIIGNHPGLSNCGGITAAEDGGNNLADDDSCGPIPDTLTLLDSVLMDNGGPTETHALMVGSTAVDAGGVCGLPTDQRGVARDDGLCDSGSYELTGCLAADGDMFTIPDGTVISMMETFETCTLIALADVDVVSPSGHLILRTAGRVEFGNGFEVDGLDALLTVEIDPGIVMPASG